VSPMVPERGGTRSSPNGLQGEKRNYGGRIQRGRVHVDFVVTRDVQIEENEKVIRQPSQEDLEEGLNGGENNAIVYLLREHQIFHGNHLDVRADPYGG